MAPLLVDPSDFVPPVEEAVLDPVAAAAPEDVAPPAAPVATELAALAALSAPDEASEAPDEAVEAAEDAPEEVAEEADDALDEEADDAWMRKPTMRRILLKKQMTHSTKQQTNERKTRTMILRRQKKQQRKRKTHSMKQQMTEMKTQMMLLTKPTMPTKQQLPLQLCLPIH